MTKIKCDCDDGTIGPARTPEGDWMDQSCPRCAGRGFIDPPYAIVEEPCPSCNVEAMPRQKFNGLDPKTNALVFEDGSERQPGIDPQTREYSTAQMMFDEMNGGDTSQPLFD